MKERELAEVRLYLKLWGELYLIDKNPWIKEAIKRLLTRETELRGIML